MVCSVLRHRQRTHWVACSEAFRYSELVSGQQLSRGGFAEGRLEMASKVLCSLVHERQMLKCCPGQESRQCHLVA